MQSLVKRTTFRVAELEQLRPVHWPDQSHSLNAMLFMGECVKLNYILLNTVSIALAASPINFSMPKLFHASNVCLVNALPLGT